MGKKDKKNTEPEDHSQDLVRAQADLLDYLHYPRSDTEIRTFSSVDSALTYPLSAIQVINNERKQLFQAKLVIDNIPEPQWTKMLGWQKLIQEKTFDSYIASYKDKDKTKEADEKYAMNEFKKLYSTNPGYDMRIGRKTISFIQDKSLIDYGTKQFVEEILKISVSAAKRADSLINMEKDKKAKQNTNPFGLFSGLRSREESDEEDYEEDEPEENDVEVEERDPAKI